MYVGLTADPLVMQVYKETIKSSNNSIEIRIICSKQIMLLVYLVSKSYRSTQKNNEENQLCCSFRGNNLQRPR